MRDKKIILAARKLLARWNDYAAQDEHDAETAYRKLAKHAFLDWMELKDAVENNCFGLEIEKG